MKVSRKNQKGELSGKSRFVRKFQLFLVVLNIIILLALILLPRFFVGEDENLRTQYWTWVIIFSAIILGLYAYKKEIILLFIILVFLLYFVGMLYIPFTRGEFTNVENIFQLLPLSLSPIYLIFLGGPFTVLPFIAGVILLIVNLKNASRLHFFSKQ